MPGAHTAVVHELLVRYLDAWTARTLHSARAVTYAQLTGAPPAGEEDPAAAALRVFGEFADRLHGRTVTVLVARRGDADVERVRADLATAAADAGLAPDVVRLVVTAGSPRVPMEDPPLFAYLDHRGGSPPEEALAGRRGVEVLVRGPAADLGGWPRRAAVELVDRDGRAETVSFGAGDERALSVFKDELWSLDEYAGIRYRDPADPDGTLLDISLKPPVGPLRRWVGAELSDGPRSLAQLREDALGATIYRADDVTRAVTELVHGATVEREPAGGRLTPATRLSLAG